MANVSSFRSLRSQSQEELPDAFAVGRVKQGRGLCHSFHFLAHVHRAPMVCLLTAARITLRDGRVMAAAPEGAGR